MLKNLNKIFPSLVAYSNTSENKRNDYNWFITEDNDMIGILKEELTQKDIALLETFLTPYDVLLPRPTETERQWLTIVQSELGADTGVNKKPFRFVYFSFSKNQIEPASFKEAIHELFNIQIPILWQNEHEGVMIEEQASIGDEKISYEQIIDVLMSDLYVKIKFFVGPFIKQMDEAHDQYHYLLESVAVSLQYSDKDVTTYIDTVPFLFVDHAGKHLRKDISHAILKDAYNDEELLHTIEIFMHCNLNVSVAAKELYMHRNSLQYRLDKFHEKTGFDVRQFNQAITVYLAMLSKKGSEES